MIWLGVDVWCGRADGIQFAKSMGFLAAAHATLLAGMWLLGKGGEAKKDANKVWFPLHALANAYIVVHSAPDLAAILLDPLATLTTSVGGMGKTIGMVMAVHIYHAVAFTLSGEDLIHHGVSVGIVNPKPETREMKPEIRNQKPETPTPEPWNPCTLQPKPLTSKP